MVHHIGKRRISTLYDRRVIQIVHLRKVGLEISVLRHAPRLHPLLPRGAGGFEGVVLWRDEGQLERRLGKAPLCCFGSGYPPLPLVYMLAF